MLVSNAEKLCTERGFHGYAEMRRYGHYDFVINTAAGRYRLPVTPGRGSVEDTGRINEYVVEAILLHDKPLASTSRGTD
jgi:hypothetical protein